MEDGSSPKIALPNVIGPNRSPVTNGTVYEKKDRTIEEAAARAVAGSPVPNSSAIRLPNPNQGSSY